MSSSEFKPQERYFDFSAHFKCFEETTNLIDVVEEFITNNSVELYEVWHSVWADRGHDILHETWKAKYGHFLVDNAKQEADDSKPSVTNHDLEESEQNWQLVWDEHFAEIYEKYYNYYVDVFWFYCHVLNESAKEVVLDNSTDLETEIEEITNLASDVECMRLLGLPTSFSNPNRKSHNVKHNLYLTEYLNDNFIIEEELSEEEEELYTSDSDNSENLDLNMAKSKHAVTSAKESASAKLKKIQHKKKKNRYLRHVPEFLRENNLLKYWHKRYSLFSRFDQGIQLDQESWFSVTPEKVASNLAKRLKCDVIIDGFCGCGGNTIQFANYCERVIAIDIDSSKIAMARNNAEIYGVSHKIEFIVDDFLNFCANTKLTADVVFLSPPWGGPQYKKNKNYDIETSLIPVGATELMSCAHKLSENVALFLPRNSNMQQIIKLAGNGNECEIQHNFLNERLIAITAFYGSDIIKKKPIAETITEEE